MGKLLEYRAYIQELIKQHGSYKPEYGDIEAQLLFDTQNDHYQLLDVGWHDKQRVRDCILHLDIKDGKIWIQHDGTEVGAANQLVKAGVPKEDIVLAFHAPSKRKYTEFAVR